MNKHLLTSVLTGILLTPELACNQLEVIENGDEGDMIPAEVVAAFENSCTTCHHPGGNEPSLEGSNLSNLVGGRYVMLGNLPASEIAVRLLSNETLTAIGVTPPTMRMPPGGPYDTPDIRTIVAWIAGADFPDEGMGTSETNGGSTGIPEPLDATFDNVVANVLGSATCSCHYGSSGPGGLKLDAEILYDSIVNKPSIGSPTKNYITPNDLANSYMYIKIANTMGIVGDQMPPGTPMLSDDKIQLLADWIEAGAMND